MGNNAGKKNSRHKLNAKEKAEVASHHVEKVLVLNGGKKSFVLKSELDKKEEEK